MTQTALFACGLLAVSFSSLAAPAAPITFSETVSGDLSDSVTPTTFTLDVGANTITGQVTNSLGALPSDFDAFGLIVPAGLNVTSASIAHADVSGNMSYVIWQVRGGSTDYSSSSTLFSPSVDSPGSTAMPAITASPLHVRTFAMGMAGSLATSSYVFTFNVVAAVPEPATLSLLALSSLALLHRRRSC